MKKEKKETKNEIIIIDDKIKKKQLVFDENLRQSWEKFLGTDYDFKFGQFCSRAKDNATVKIYDENLQLSNGLLFLEYTNVFTKLTSTIYENEWLITKGKKFIHATDYFKKRFNAFYSKDLELIPIYRD